MSFQGYNLSLTPRQKIALSKGYAVKISSDHLVGNDVVFLTKTQAHQIGKAVSQAKGYMLQFSRAQARYNSKHGHGFFDFLKSAARAIAPIAMPLVGNLAKTVITKI